MNTSSKAQNIEAMFTRIAPRYDLLNRLMSFSIDKLWRKKAVRFLSDDGQSNFLDLCAGTLDLTLEIFHQYKNAHITALDFSGAMLEIGEKKIPLPFKTQVNTVVGDAMHLPFPNSSFDGMICGFGMRNIVDNLQSLHEAFRVLKPGSSIVTLEFFRPTTLIGRFFYATYGKWIIPTLGRWLTQDAAYRYLFESIQSYFSIEEYAELLKKAGFQNIQWKALSGGIAYIVWGKRP